MQDSVFGDNMSEVRGVLEHLGPLLDSSDVVLHVFAVLKGIGELIEDSFGFSGSLNNMTVSDLAESINGFFGEVVSSLVASLELSEVVFTSHSSDESSEPFGDRFELESAGSSYYTSG